MSLTKAERHVRFASHLKGLCLIEPLAYMRAKPEELNMTRPCMVGSMLCGIVALASGMDARAGCVVPTDNLVIVTDTTICPGTWNLNNGIIICASNVTLDLNQAKLVGPNVPGQLIESYGVRCGIGFCPNDPPEPIENITIKNGTITNFYYAVRIENAKNVTIKKNDLSYNFIDPNPCPANVTKNHVIPDWDLGGGIYMYQVSDSFILDNVMVKQQNGINLFNVNNTVVQGNDASFNVGWGIHLNNSSKNQILWNKANHCDLPGACDEADMLVINGSNNNLISHNDLQYGGDGIFLGHENSQTEIVCQSNDNQIEYNNCSHAENNCIEATFSSGNQFIGNVCDDANYGFWLGYSHAGNIVSGNKIRNNHVNGIQIDAGQNNFIVNNTISGNAGHGVLLGPGGPYNEPCHDPMDGTSHGYVITGNCFTKNGQYGLALVQTWDCLVADNIFTGNGPHSGPDACCYSATSDLPNKWNYDEPFQDTNIVGGPWKGGNYWENYFGEDLVGNDLIGDTNVPHKNCDRLGGSGDKFPLIPPCTRTLTCPPPMNPLPPCPLCPWIEANSAPADGDAQAALNTNQILSILTNWNSASSARGVDLNANGQIDLDDLLSALGL